MKKTVVGLISLCALLIVALIGGIGAYQPKPIVSNADMKIVDANLQDVYELGSFVSISNTYTVEYEGQSYTTNEVNVLSPNGKVYPAGDFRLIYSGKYTLVGYFLTGENEQKVEKSFYVKDGDKNDEEAPTILVDCNLSGLGSIFVGVGETVEIFEANCNDEDFTGDIIAEVFYNYGTSVQTSVNVVDNRFVVAHEGAYTIVYTAKDVFGNVGVETVCVTSVELGDKSPISLSVVPITESVSGEETILNEHKTEGINGEILVAITASNEQERIQINPITRAFVPSYTGVYTIEYVYNDNVYKGRYSYEISVRSENVRQLISTPTLPRYFIKNAFYSLDGCVVYEYTDNGPKPLEMQCAIAYGDSEQYNVVNGEKFQVSGAQTAKIRYQAKNDESYCIEVGEVLIRDVGYGENLSMDKYFIGDFVAKKKATSIAFTSNSGNDTEKLEFINPISFSQFTFNFRIPTQTTDFQRMDVVLSDYYSSETNIKISYLNKGGKIYLVFDGEEYRLKGMFGDGSMRLLQMKNDALFVEDISIAIDNIFETDLCYLSFVFSGISNGAGIDIVKINNQTVNSVSTDEKPPIIYVKDVKGSYKINERMTIPVAVVSDVLSPILFENIFVSVENPDGSWAVSEENISLDGTASGNVEHSIKLTQYGKYTVRYSAKDMNCKDLGTKTVFFYVLNDIAPTISFDGIKQNNLTFRGELGETRTIKNYLVSDDYDTEAQLTVISCVMHNNATIAYNQPTFTLDEEGLYTVYVYCIDSVGNYSFAYYNILVEKGA